MAELALTLYLRQWRSRAQPSRPSSTGRSETHRSQRGHPITDSIVDTYGVKDGKDVADERLLAHLRGAVPAAGNVTYLNGGAAGPLLNDVATAMHDQLALEVVDGRASTAEWVAFHGERTALRRDLGEFIGATADEIMLTHNTTEGLNTVLWGLDWQPGDRLITTNLEHPTMLAALYGLARRVPVHIDAVDIGTGGSDQTLALLDAALAGGGVRVVVISHVAWSTGARLPVSEIVDLAHSRGALVLVDGAQAVGAVPVDMRGLGCDFYAFPSYKWLCGPEGIGCLFVSAASLGEVQPTYVGAFGTLSGQLTAGDSASLVFAEGAERFEGGSVHRPLVAGLRATLAWHRRTGVDEVRARVAAVALECAARTHAFPGAELLTPAPGQSGLVAFRLAGVDVARCVDDLDREHVTIRSVASLDALRISCGFYTDDSDLDRAFALLATAAGVRAGA